MKHLLRALALILLMAPTVWGQVSMTTSSGYYVQNFNSLSSAANGTNVTWTENSTIPGWYAQRQTGGAFGQYQTHNGGSNSGLLYSYGTTSATDRALGSVASGTPNDIAYALVLQNTSGSTISSITIQYYGEQWREGTIANPNTLQATYRTDDTLSNVTTLTPGTDVPAGWTAVTALNFVAPNSAVASTALDGNSASNRILLTATISVTLANNEYFAIRFKDNNDPGADGDDGIAVDDLIVAWETSAAGDEWYVWNAPAGGAYTTTTNWTPTRATTATSDQLIYNVGGTLTSTSVPTETNAQLIVTGTTNLTLQAGAASQTYALSNRARIESGSTLNLGTTAQSFSLTNADSSFSGAGSLNISGAAHTLNFGAAAPAFPTGTINLGTTSSVRFVGDRPQTIIPRTDYATIWVVRTSAGTWTKTLGSGNLTASAGITIGGNVTFSLGSSPRIVTVTGNSSFSGAGTLDLSGAAHTVNIEATTPGFPTTFTPGTTSTVVFNRNGNQTIPAVTYASLSLTTGGTKTLTGNTTATGTFTLSRPLNHNGFLFTLGSSSTTGTLAGGQRTFGGLFRRFVNTSTAAFTWPVSVSATDFRSVNLQFPITGNEAGAYVEMQVRDFQTASGLPDITPSDFPLATEAGQPGHPDEIFSTGQVMNVKWDINYFDPNDNVPDTYDITVNSVTNGLDISGAASSSLRLFKSTGTVPRFEIVRGFSAIGTSIAGFTITSIAHTGVDQGFSQFYIGTLEEATVLPVTWLGLSATREGSATARVRWSTASELNNERFEVQRSRRADFAEFGTVGTVTGRGTSSQVNEYSLLDADAGAGTVYYRIRQVDFDGRSSLSRVVALDGGTEISLYPNPVADRVQLLITGEADVNTPVRVRLLGSDGRQLLDLSAPAATVSEQLSRTLAAQAPGLYLVQVAGKTHRIVKN